MKRKIAKFILYILLVITVAIVSISAYDAVTLTDNSAFYSRAVYCADLIQTKYRTYKGVRQYRKWNKTQRYWVLPHWRNI